MGETLGDGVGERGPASDTDSALRQPAQPDDESGGLTVTSLRPEDGRVGGSGRRGAAGWRVWYRAAGALLLVALVAAFALTLVLPRLPRPVPPKPLPDPLALNVGDAGETCVDGVAWSPDGTRLAVLGGDSCLVQTATSYAAEKLVVYDARTGRQMWSKTFGGPVLQQIVPPSMRGDAGALAQVAINYSAPLWSPDGRSIALSFNAFQTYTPGQNGEPKQYGWGLIVVPLATADTRVIEGPSVVSVAGGTGLPGLTEPYPVGRWDLRAGRLEEISLAPGLAYTWANQDELVRTAEQPTGQGAAVGNPLGGRSFTLWQSGTVSYAPANGCAPPNGPNPSPPPAYSPNDFYVLSLGATAWSPDGRYLLWGPDIEGRLPLAPSAPGPTPTLLPPFQRAVYNCSDFGPASRYSLLPIRDAGLRAALGEISLGTNPSVEVMWRPDGKVLAVAPGDVASGEPALTLYDTTTGRVLRQFSLTQIETWAAGGGQLSGGPFAAMAWSPDGARMALLPAGPNPEVLVLGPKTLGT